MAAADEMSCRDVVELVTEYLEGTLSSPDRLRFDEHLGICPPCQTYLDQMRQTLRAVGSLPRESISDDARKALLRLFRDWKKQ
jgi:anti-sigma factor RsiW